MVDRWEDNVIRMKVEDPTRWSQQAMLNMKAQIDIQAPLIDALTKFVRRDFWWYLSGAFALGVCVGYFVR